MKKIFCLLLILFLFSCDKGPPLSKLYNPGGDEILSSEWGDWIIYDDALKTRGGMSAFTGIQELDFECKDNPWSGNRCIKFSWDGNDVVAGETGNPQHGYCGFSLVVVPDASAYNYDTSLMPGKDLTPGAYARITFYARGSLSTDNYLRLESPLGTWQSVSPNEAWQGTVSDTWQKYEFNCAGNTMTDIKEFVKIILKYTGSGKGNGGTVYIDDIKYTK